MRRVNDTDNCGRTLNFWKSCTIALEYSKRAKNKRTTISNDTLIVLTANQGL